MSDALEGDDEEFEWFVESSTFAKEHGNIFYKLSLTCPEFCALNFFFNISHSFLFLLLVLASVL